MGEKRLTHYHFAASSISSERGDHAVNHFGADALIRLLESRPGRLSPKELADPALAAHNTIAWAMESVQNGCKGFDLRRPSLLSPSVADIDFLQLNLEAGIKYLLIDLDATLTEPLGMKIEKRAYANICYAIENGWLEQVCIVSNVGIYPLSWRLESIATEYGMLCHACWWPMAMKPKTKALEEAMQLLPTDANTENTMMVGDQTWTDIAAANMAGMLSVLVPPLGQIHGWKAAEYASQNEFLTRLKMSF